MTTSQHQSRIGCTVDPADPIGAAAERGAEAVQILLGDPQSWTKPATQYPDGPEALKQAVKDAGLSLYVHAPYVINVASPNNRIRIPSRKLLQQTLDAAAAVGALGVVVHGGHITKNDDPGLGYDNWRKAVEGLNPVVPLFIENTAGGDHAVARRLESIGRLWEALDGHDVGFCLDTCHAFAGGEPLETVVGKVMAITGRIDLVHANDSQGGLDSGRDRHANFGEGEIAPDDLAVAVRAAAAVGADFVCETPGDAAAQASDIAWIRTRLAASE
ncbi:MAG: deoxyribonuclease IV [Actinocrinis sp.]